MAPRLAPSRSRCWTSRKRMSPASASPTASSSTIVHSSRCASRSTRRRPASAAARPRRRRAGRAGGTRPSGSRNRLKTPIGGPPTGSPSDAAPVGVVAAGRAGTARRARRGRSGGPAGPCPGRAHRWSPPCGAAVGCGRRPAPSPGSRVLGRHRRQQAVEAGLAGQLGVERGGDDVPLRAPPRRGRRAGCARTSTSGPDALDDGRPDEDGVDGLGRRASGTTRSVSNESSWRPNALRSTVTSSSGEDRRLAAGDLVGQHDHPGAGAEDRRAASRPGPGSAGAGPSGR